MDRATLDGQAQKLCIYIGESDSWRGRPLYAAILDALKAHGLAGATVLRGIAGFGAHSRVIHSAAIVRLSQDLPLRIEVVDRPEAIAEALTLIEPMVDEGLMTLEPVQVIRYTHRYLHTLPADRLVSEVMTRYPVSLRADATVAEAWQTMLQWGVKTLPVVSEGVLVGMLTDEDLLQRAGLAQRLSVARQLDAQLVQESVAALETSALQVSQVMSQPVIAVSEGDRLGQAVRLMVGEGVKRLPVVDAGGRLVGVLSRVDVLRQVCDIAPEHEVPEAFVGVLTTLGDVMSPKVPAVRYDSGLQAIITAFVQSGSHRLVVTGADGRVIGLISDADVVGRLPSQHQRGLLAALRGRGRSPELSVTARDIMSEGALTAPPEMTIVEALRLMIPEGRKWIVVVDDAGRPLGLADRAILFSALTGEASHGRA